MSSIVFIWDATTCADDHAVIILLGSVINMTIASIMGVVTPLAMDRISYDPSAFAGPFETAFQDIIGFICFIYMAKNIISYAPPDACSL